MIDILYVSHNRLRFTEASFHALLDNTDWSLVNRLHIRDDASEDGTFEYLRDQVAGVPVRCDLVHDTFGGPVAAMNDALDHCDAEIIAKVDSDLIVCPGWLNEMDYVLDNHRSLDVLGMEPGFGGPVESWVRAAGLPPRGAKNAPHVGGIGLFRTRIFGRHRPRPDNRWFGWTQFQKRHANCAWITPDLPVFLLDHLPFEPWRSLAAAYVEKGWSRSWSSYPRGWGDYWEWFAPDWALLAV